MTELSMSITIGDICHLISLRHLLLGCAVARLVAGMQAYTAHW